MESARRGAWRSEIFAVVAAARCFALAALGALTAAPALLAQSPALPGIAEPKPSDPHVAAAAAAARVARDRAILLELRHPNGWSQAGQRLFDRAVDFLPSLGAAIIVLLAFYLFYRVTSRLLRRVLHRAHADPAAQEIGLKLTKFVIIAFGVVMAAGQLGFQVASVLAGLGIVGLAVGLAAQDTLANLVAGITILSDRPFRIGDNVTIAGTFGTVQEIGLRTTRILTAEKIDAILPNKTIINEKILNHTRTPQLRLGIPVGIGYGEDIAEARRALVAAVAEHPNVLADPPPKVVVTRLGDSAVDLEVRVWLTNPHLEREVQVDLLERVKLALDGAGIEMPFPTHAVVLSGAVPAAPVPPAPAAPPDAGETGRSAEDPAAR